jgi:nucleoside-diphosphate-sugar epimerase
MNKWKILVTGASGMVGYHLCKYLVKQGHAVIALVRKTSVIDDLASLSKFGDCKVVQVELFQQSELVSQMQGIDVVIHAAGCVDPLGNRDYIRKVNVEGTQSVLESAIKASVKQFIYISSLSVITGQEDQYNVAEDAPLKMCGEPYADSKVEAERLVMQAANKINVVALRPGFIYGPQERSWMPRLINSIAKRKAALIDGGTKETNVIYVENLCQATASAIMNEKAYGQVYNLTDGQKVTKKELFDAIATELNLPKVEKVLPSAIARPFCETVSALAPIMPESLQKHLTRYSRAAYRLAGVNQGFSCAKAERDLDYTSRISFAEGMKTTLKSFNGGAGR